MKIIHLLAAAALILVASISTSLAAPATNESCEAMFTKLDANNDGNKMQAECLRCRSTNRELLSSCFCRQSVSDTDHLSE